MSSIHSAVLHHRGAHSQPALPAQFTSTLIRMLSIFAAPITQAIVLCYGYCSFKAIESDKGKDDTRTLRKILSPKLIMLEVHIPASSCIGRRLAHLLVRILSRSLRKGILDYVSVIIPFYEEAYIAS